MVNVSELFSCLFLFFCGPLRFVLKAPIQVRFTTDESRDHAADCISVHLMLLMTASAVAQEAPKVVAEPLTGKTSTVPGDTSELTSCTPSSIDYHQRLFELPVADSSLFCIN